MVWPIGDNIEYPEPVWKVKVNDKEGVTSMKDICNAAEKKKKNVQKKKKPNKKRKPKRGSDSDDDSNDSSDESDADVNEDVADKLTVPRDQNVVMNSFQSNEIHHFANGISSDWSYQNFCY